MRKLIFSLGIVVCSAVITVLPDSLKANNFSISLSEQPKTETFKVYGNCGMCENAIEGSLKDVEGVEKADWDRETKMIEVTYDPEVISLTEIKKLIAEAGYDSDEVKATKEAYNKLPGCCHYERPE